MSKAKPVFVDGVWVGRLADQRYVVFDPALTNLYVGSQVVLWNVATKSWDYFDIAAVRKELGEHLHTVSDQERARIVLQYWTWKCEGRGSSKGEYENLCKQRVAALARQDAEPDYEQSWERASSTSRRQQDTADDELSPEDYYLQAVMERGESVPIMTAIEQIGGLADIQGNRITD